LQTPELIDDAEKVRRGMEQILDSSVTLLADFGYALLSARLLADVVIAVVVAAELLKQADVDPRRVDLAGSWINRRMLDVEWKTQRIREGSSARIDRCESIIELVR
jgi:hypothetical protein